MKTTYGLVGYPLGHSLSPVMHNTAFKELGVDAEYVLFPMPKEELKSFFEGLKLTDSTIFGLNVTVPHKENVLPFLDTLDPFAEKVGAVNTVVISNKRKLIGFNTDGPGFLTHLTESNFQPTGKRIAILGAGGASRALISVFLLLPERPESIKLFDIDRNRADNLVKDLGRRMDASIVEIVTNIDDLNIELSDLLINATPIGMKSDDLSLVADDRFHKHLLVYDLVYNPAKTKLLQQAEAAGAKGVNGLRMLYYQGVLAFQRWAEMQLPETVKARMWQELEAACYKVSH